MLRGYDRGSTNGAEVLLSDIRTTLQKAISHPYIPPDAQDLFLGELRRMRMLRDDNFESELMKQAITDAPEYLDHQRKFIATVNAVQLDGRGILLRRSYFAADPGAVSHGQDLIAEELGHAFHANKSPIPLQDIPDGSFLLFPHETKQDVLKQLREDHVIAFPKVPICTMESISVEPNGFSSHFKNAQHGLTYPILQSQLSFEETRSALIQTVLEMSFLGQRYASHEKPGPRFARGMELLFLDISRLPAFFPREIGAINFINEMAKRFDGPKDFFHWLFTRLYTDNLDEFLDQLDEDGLVALRSSYSLVQGELVRRPTIDPIKQLVYGNK